MGGLLYRGVTVLLAVQCYIQCMLYFKVDHCLIERTFLDRFLYESEDCFAIEIMIGTVVSKGESKVYLNIKDIGLNYV